MLYKLFIIIIIVLKMISAPAALPNADVGGDPVLDRTLSFLRENINDGGVGSVGGEWSVIALSAGGVSDEALYSAYLDSITDQVVEKLSGNPGDVPDALDKHKATENARIVLALCSIGADPTNVGGHDLTAALTDTEWVCSATLNSPIFALIALDSCGSDDSGAKDALVSYILGKQLGDGGWALSGEKADPDVTAMALQALAFHRDDPAVSEAAGRAIDTLSAIQLDDGGFRSWGTVSSESVSQVVIALSAWGIDSASDPRFVKNGTSAYDALLSFEDASGGFLDVRATEARPGAGEVNIMATEQAALALVAYSEYKNGGGMLYSFAEK